MCVCVWGGGGAAALHPEVVVKGGGGVKGLGGVVGGVHEQAGEGRGAQRRAGEMGWEGGPGNRGAVRWQLMLGG